MTIAKGKWNIELGADMNAPLRSEATALQSAAAMGYVRITQILPNTNANVNALGSHGRALEIVARSRQVYIEWLCKHRLLPFHPEDEQIIHRH